MMALPQAARVVPRGAHVVVQADAEGGHRLVTHRLLLEKQHAIPIQPVLQLLRATYHDVVLATASRATGAHLGRRAARALGLRRWSNLELEEAVSEPTTGGSQAETASAGRFPWLGGLRGSSEYSPSAEAGVDVPGRSFSSAVQRGADGLLSAHALSQLCQDAFEDARSALSSPLLIMGLLATLAFLLSFAAQIFVMSFRAFVRPPPALAPVMRTLNGVLTRAAAVGFTLAFVCGGVALQPSRSHRSGVLALTSAMLVFSGYFTYFMTNYAIGFWGFREAVGGGFDICPAARVDRGLTALVGATQLLLACVSAAPLLLLSVELLAQPPRSRELLRLTWTCFGARSLVAGLINALVLIRCASYSDFEGSAAFPMGWVLCAVQWGAAVLMLWPGTLSTRERLQLRLATMRASASDIAPLAALLGLSADGVLAPRRAVRIALGLFDAPELGPDARCVLESRAARAMVVVATAGEGSARGAEADLELAVIDPIEPAPHASPAAAIAPELSWPAPEGSFMRGAGLHSEVRAEARVGKAAASPAGVLNAESKESGRAAADDRLLPTADAYVVHAAADDFAARARALNRWAAAFASEHGRSPRVWVQWEHADPGLTPEERLAHLPTYLGRSRRLLLLAGPRLALELECAVAMYVWRATGGTLDAVDVVPTASSQQEHTAAVASFDTFAVLFSAMPPPGGARDRLVRCVQLATPHRFNEVVRAYLPVVRDAWAERGLHEDEGVGDDVTLTERTDHDS